MSPGSLRDSTAIPRRFHGDSTEAPLPFLRDAAALSDPFTDANGKPT
jgi:hypothetical protein